MLLSHFLEPLVYTSQVDAARNKAILWTVFAAVMIGVAIWRIVAKTRGSKPDQGDR
jgi:hypothetical protein